MDKLTDLKLQAFATWMAQRGIYYHARIESWVDMGGRVVAVSARQLTEEYERDLVEQYVS